MTTTKQPKKCYNSFSCILSVLIIVFVLGSIVWDLTVAKPELRSNIASIKQEVQTIHKKIDDIQEDHQAYHAIMPVDTTAEMAIVDSIYNEIQIAR